MMIGKISIDKHQYTNGEYFIKGKTDYWINIKTSTNREMKVTPDHNIAVIKDNNLIIKEAKDIECGDRVG